jgi:glycine hydroxymethyltransferase
MTGSALTAYLSQTQPEHVDPGFLGYVANLTQVATVQPSIAASIVQELADQRANLKMIASENYCSLATQLAMGNLLTDKYAEGFPMHRFYPVAAMSMRSRPMPAKRHANSSAVSMHTFSRIAERTPT